jgi:hypothetical protein
VGSRRLQKNRTPLRVEPGCPHPGLLRPRDFVCSLFQFSSDDDAV